VAEEMVVGSESSQSYSYLKQGVFLAIVANEMGLVQVELTPPIKTTIKANISLIRGDIDADWLRYKGCMVQLDLSTRTPTVVTIALKEPPESPFIRKSLQPRAAFNFENIQKNDSAPTEETQAPGNEDLVYKSLIDIILPIRTKLEKNFLKETPLFYQSFLRILNENTTSNHAKVLMVHALAVSYEIEETHTKKCCFFSDDSSLQPASKANYFIREFGKLNVIELTEDMISSFQDSFLYRASIDSFTK